MNGAQQDEVLIKVNQVGKTFKLPHEKQTSLKSTLINILRGGNRSYEEQHALKDISFEVKKGEFIGIVGRNGSGKSTLLKLLAGTYIPTKGTVQVNGKLTPFIELGVGFSPELTGRENVYLNGALLGFNRKEVAAMYDDIVEFAEIKRFMDQKLKNYSSGMQVRLAFSIAVKVNSSILLLDEVLAVGDAAFQKKCFDYFRKLKKDQKTVVFISHDMNAIREYCDRAMLIDKGVIKVSGTPNKVAEAYTKLFMDNGDDLITSGTRRWGVGGARIKDIKIIKDDKQITITVSYIFEQDISHPVFGLSIHNPIGLLIFESNTRWKHQKTSDFIVGQTALVTWKIPNNFTNGNNTITPSIADQDSAEIIEVWEEAAILKIEKEEVTTALTLPDATVTVKA